ncbi:MAG: hypothetical protein HRT88_12420 [Lentisphaeraceae bacterium]|nr:hypothetical protein [Lentisphaeraceae bacterium]
MSKLKKVRRKMMWPVEVFLIYSVFFSVRCLTLKGARRLGAFLGSILYLIPNQRKLAFANLKVAFPDKAENERKAIAKKSMIHMVTVFVEFMWTHNNEKRLQKYVEIPQEVLDEYEKYHESGAPSIFIAMHWGNWEMGCYGLMQLGKSAKLGVVARRAKHPVLENFITAGRESSGAKVIHEKGAVRSLMKYLRAGDNVGLLVDQNTKTHQGGTFVNFFDLPVTISKTPATLARRNKANVMLFVCRRTPEGFRAELTHLPKPSAEYESDEALTAGIMDMMEPYVKNTPEQWIWLYNRWNYIPQNRQDLKERYPYYAVMDKHLGFEG